jgi:hypothetical protein
MKRFMTTLLGAGLALLVASTAKAELFTVDRTVFPTSVSHVSGAGSVIVDFTTVPGETNPPQDSLDPGSNFTALNYQLKTTGTPSLYTFNPLVDTFSLAVTFKSYGPGSTGATYTVNFAGNIDGVLSQTQNTVSVNLTPTTVDFNLGTVPFHVYNYKSTDALVDDANSFGAISFRALTPVPEPGSMALLAMGALPVLGLIRRRRK